MAVNNSVKLYTDTIASIKTRGIIGEKFLALSPGGGGDPLNPGDTIRDTESGLDLEEAVDRVGDRFDERGALARKVSRDQPLLPILPATDVEEIDIGGDSVLNPDGAHLERDVTPATAPCKDGNVAAICVDIEVVRVEVPNHQVPETSHA